MNQGEEDIVTAGMGWADLLPNVYQLIDPNKPEKNARTNNSFGTQTDSHVVRTIYYQISIIQSL